MPYPKIGAPKVSHGIAADEPDQEDDEEGRADVFDEAEVEDMDEEALAALLAKCENLEGDPLLTPRMAANAASGEDGYASADIDQLKNLA